MSKINPRTISFFLEFMNIIPKLPDINESGVGLLGQETVNRNNLGLL